MLKKFSTTLSILILTFHPISSLSAENNYPQEIKPRGGFPDIDLAALTPQQGVAISGMPFGGTGWPPMSWPISNSGAGDINGDGIDDVIIGLPTVEQNGEINAGACYIIYGKQDGYSTPIDLANLSPAEGFAVLGSLANDNTGYAVSKAGDVNNDGIDDVIIGAPFADPNGRASAGITYVIYGKQGGYSTPIDLASLSSIQGFAIYGAAASDALGFSVRNAGDINADGIGDIIIGASFGTPVGRTSAGLSYVIYGKQGGYDTTLDLNSFSSSQGFIMYGAATDDNLGSSVSGAGDINGDGIDDIIIGAPRVAPGTTRDSAGASYIIYGKQGGYSAPIDLFAFSSTKGFAVLGSLAFDSLGSSVSSAGDSNGDGIDDVIIGAPFADTSDKVDAGISYVIYGKQAGYSVPIDVTTLSITEGIAILGPSSIDHFGTSVANAGDINGDGISDIICGAPLAYPGISQAGISYVIYGKQGGYGTSSINLSSINGFAINGAAVNAQSGISVSNAGDFNNDGANDVLIGALGRFPLNGTQTGYVIYGTVIPSPSSSSSSSSLPDSSNSSSSIASSQTGTNSETIASNASIHKPSWYALPKWLVSYLAHQP